jgi:hypothetical protein
VRFAHGALDPDLAVAVCTVNKDGEEGVFFLFNASTLTEARRGHTFGRVGQWSAGRQNCRNTASAASNSLHMAPYIGYTSGSSATLLA